MTAPLRSLGLDPGERTGWGVVDMTAPRETVIAFGELDQADPVAHLERLLEEHRPAIVAIEVVKHVHPVDRRGISGISTHQALALYRAGLRAGELKRTAEGWGAHVDPFGAENWRGGTVGSQRASNREIEDELRQRLISFPAARKSTEHARDGIGIALFGGLRAGLRALGARDL